MQSAQGRLSIEENYSGERLTPQGSMRQKLLYIFALGCLSGFIVSSFSCIGEKPFPFPTLATDIASNSPPSLPYNPSPPNGAVNVIRTVVLSWQAFDPDGEDLLFDVYFHTDSVFGITNILSEGQTDTFFVIPSALSPNTTYYWKIDVKDASDNWRFGELWSFTTGTEVNNAPVAAILSPEHESQFIINEEIVFKGKAFDIEDGILTGSALVWNSDIDGAFGTDTVVVISTLSSGIHSIVFEATDSGDKTGRDTIQITVIDTSTLNNPPSATILFPQDGASFFENDTIAFRGRGLDIEDGVLSGTSLTWSSSLDGLLGIDTILVVTDLSIGAHTITLRVTDSGDKFREHQIQIIIEQAFNSPPTVQIVQPFHLTPYAADSVITFSGTAVDIEDGALTGASVTWTSDLDGLLGTGTNFTMTGLSLGLHTITMRAEDSGLAFATDQVMINVTPVGDANQPPIATILQPRDDKVFIEGSPVTFQGSGIDQEDGTIQDRLLRWTSDRDGFLGTGTSLTISTLQRGRHLITLKVRDSGGKQDSSGVNIFISAVNNTPPIARFNITQILPPATPGTVDITLDASILYDATNNMEDIEIRWDFDNDGVYDTPFTLEKTASYSYTSGIEPHFVKLLVRDGNGLTDAVSLIVPEYVYVPAGNFQMGSLSGSPADEQPRRTVYLDVFYIDRFEITNAQFASFLSDNGNPEYYSSWMSITKLPDNSYVANDGFENFPVRYVDWIAAEAYVSWYNKRLPTEAEWEKAARGGEFLDEAGTLPNPLPTRDYPWSADEITAAYANYLIVGRPFDWLAPAGIYTGQLINGVQTVNNASPYGAFDMLGNIAEWVSDWYKADYYSSSPTSNPTGPAAGEFKVFRGGSFDQEVDKIYITRRFQAIPTARPYIVGFRTVITP